MYFFLTDLGYFVMAFMACPQECCIPVVVVRIYLGTCLQQKFDRVGVALLAR
jgi:hypothetical protein